MLDEIEHHICSGTSVVGRVRVFLRLSPPVSSRAGQYKVVDERVGLCLWRPAVINV